MPIVDIELVADPTGTVASNLAQSLADAVGHVLKSPAGQTWVRLHVLSREHYAENESPVESSELPVFVTVRKRSIPAADELKSETLALTHAVAKVLGRTAAFVHTEYAPAAQGRVSFGGTLVE